METADAWKSDDATTRDPLNRSRGRRVAIERQVGTIVVVICNVLAEDSTQMVLAEHKEVVDDLSTRGAHPSLGEPVLPGRARRD